MLIHPRSRGRRSNFSIHRLDSGRGIRASVWEPAQSLTHTLHTSGQIEFDPRRIVVNYNPMCDRGWITVCHQTESAERAAKVKGIETSLLLSGAFDV